MAVVRARVSTLHMLLACLGSSMLLMDCGREEMNAGLMLARHTPRLTTTGPTRVRLSTAQIASQACTVYRPSVPFCFWRIPATIDRAHLA
ncbi:hypothetical protein EJ02DRAFT_372735 [Clathrospora elynae]|uniref:Secreted protein n=1 Tax=Clathrospora elynae TaxID=706981 RepID=A0A6A5SX42_9PLEO|nr:hypothetical protein EJ02DRAFT_372735 [Clathrospora elynae]